MAGFNKLFVMLPVMLAARKLDAEDPLQVQYVRLAYAAIQVLCICVVLYTYFKASKVSSEALIYVPPPAQPFADPNAKPKYTRVAFMAHVKAQARSLLGSTFFGIIMTVGLHYYKGMLMGLAIQTVMAPFSLIENPMVKALLLGSGDIRPQDRIFSEKTPDEITPDMDVVDEQGVAVVVKSSETLKDGDSSASLENTILDTWDAGNKADLGKLLSNVNKRNCNYQTKEDHWTALMIVSGLSQGDNITKVIRQLVEIGANVAMVDKEGWTALHWSAFHGSVEAAKELSNQHSHLLKVKDKEGLTPLEMARKEKNNAVALVLEEALQDTKKSK